MRDGAWRLDLLIDFVLKNSYYVLRDDMLDFYLNDVSSRLATVTNGGGWEVRTILQHN